MTRIIFHHEAEQEMLDAADFYEDQKPGLGREFLKQIETTINGSVDHPKLGILLENGIRCRFIERFPFNVLYETSAGHLRILAVMHQRRLPGYWKDRIR